MDVYIRQSYRSLLYYGKFKNLQINLVQTYQKETGPICQGYILALIPSKSFMG